MCSLLQSIASARVIKKRKMNFWLFIFSIQILDIYCEIDVIKADNRSEIIDAIYTIIDELVTRHSIVNFITSAKNQRDVKFMDFRHQLMLRTKPEYFVRMDDYKRITITNDRKRVNNIFLLDTVESFRLLRDEIISTKFEFNGYFLFVLVHGYVSQLEEIFRSMWMKNIYNVNIIYENGNEIKLATFLPFESSKSCGNTQPQIINSFREGKFENELIFPPKVKNLNGCPLRVSTFEDEDVVMRKQSGEFEGYLAELLKALAQQLNFSPAISFLTHEFPYGMIYDNGSATGSLGDIFYNRSDLALGDFFLKSSRTKHLDASVPYQVMALVWLIPPGRIFSPLEKLLQPFDGLVWIFIAIILFVGIFVILIINWWLKQFKPFVFGQNVNKPLLNMIIAILGAQQQILPKRNFARFILMIFLIFCLVIRNAYQGALYQFLQSDGTHKEVQSVEEMIQKDFTFYAVEYSTFDLLNGSNPEVFKRTKKVKTENFLLEHELTGDEKVAGLKTIKSIMTSSRENLTLLYCKEPFMYLNIVFYLRKNSPFTNAINHKIDELLSAGIIQQFIRRNHYDAHAGNFARKKEKRLRKLNIWQLLGAFYLLLFGELFAVMSFIYEISAGILKKSLKSDRNT
jgi:hypothetical protein